MKSFRKELWFHVPTRRAFMNITPQVEECLRESGIKEGLVLVNAMHITASVFINDDESGLHHDYDLWLEKLAPHEPVSQYRHNVGEDNADAHMKRQIMGREVVVAVTAGKLDFGTWEQIFYGEFDGRRKKRVLVKVIGCFLFCFYEYRLKRRGNLSPSPQLQNALDRKNTWVTLHDRKGLLWVVDRPRLLFD